MRMILNKRWLVRVAAGSALLLSACGADDTTVAADDPPSIIATTSIWADVVQRSVCADGGAPAVRALIPAGNDPHGFEPSLADRADLESAALVVANGLGLEEGLDDVLSTLEAEGALVVHMTDLVETIPFATDEDHDEDHDEDEDHHEHDGDDPHIWTDPSRIARALPSLSDAIATTSGADVESAAACVEAYADELLELDSAISELVEAIPAGRRKLVTNHDALGYFADRYGFEIVGTVLPSPSGLAETNPAQLAELGETITELGVPAVFAETQSSSADAEALADSLVGVDVVTLLTGTLGSEEGTDSYVEMMRHNAELISDALAG